jgi:hypothetical protein
MSSLAIGVVGYSRQHFDRNLARALIQVAYDKAVCAFPDHEAIAVVSGYTNIGIPALAYEEAKNRGWRTVGIACKKGKDHPLFEVDEGAFVGDNWGDESGTFLEACNVLIRIGGGEQSHSEAARFLQQGGRVFAFDLPIKPAR